MIIRKSNNKFDSFYFGKNLIVKKPIADNSIAAIGIQITRAVNQIDHPIFTIYEKEVWDLGLRLGLFISNSGIFKLRVSCFDLISDHLSCVSKAFQDLMCQIMRSSSFSCLCVAHQQKPMLNNKIKMDAPTFHHLKCLFSLICILHVFIYLDIFYISLIQYKRVKAIAMYLLVKVNKEQLE